MPKVDGVTSNLLHHVMMMMMMIDIIDDVLCFHSAVEWS